MKLKTSKDTYEIVRANHENGKLNIVFENQSCEALQDIFRSKMIWHDWRFMTMMSGSALSRSMWCLNVWCLRIIMRR